MFNLTYEFKLKPTMGQTAICEDWLEQCRRVYNYALAERKDWFKSRSCQINACSIRSEFIIGAETCATNLCQPVQKFNYGQGKHTRFGCCCRTRSTTDTEKT